jgi:hypothetical protein
LNKEHRALIDFLPFDIVITLAALIMLLLSVLSFVRRFSSRPRRVAVSPVNLD